MAFQDGVKYIILLHEISPEICSLDALELEDDRQRAQEVVNAASKLNCAQFISTDSILEVTHVAQRGSQLDQGNPNLNLAFVASLFNTHPAM